MGHVAVSHRLEEKPRVQTSHIYFTKHKTASFLGRDDAPAKPAGMGVDRRSEAFLPAHLQNATTAPKHDDSPESSALLYNRIFFSSYWCRWIRHHHLPSSAAAAVTLLELAPAPMAQNLWLGVELDATLARPLCRTAAGSHYR